MTTTPRMAFIDSSQDEPEFSLFVMVADLETDDMTETVYLGDVPAVSNGCPNLAKAGEILASAGYRFVSWPALGGNLFRRGDGLNWEIGAHGYYARVEHLTHA